jgi:aspartyl aminopeptidase
MMSEKHDLLFNTDHKNGYDRFPAEEKPAMEDYCDGYKRFMTASKTEREAVDNTIALAEANGFRRYHRGDALQPGDRVYQVRQGKTILLAVIGQQSLAEGAAICAAHIDSPRLDLKPNPLIEQQEFAIFKTHYYGGIRKYQWVSIPLELHGVVCLKNGETIKVVIGQDPTDPLLSIPDLLPHLADQQSKEPLWLAFKGEDLNILVGSEPYPDQEEKERCKLLILSLLHEKYGITESDFLSAELCAVPGYDARDYGLDRSMIGAYGQDDKVCSYAALKALLDAASGLKRTGVCMLADKEEIGSMGVSGMQSQFFDTFMADLCEAQNVPLRTCYEHSFCLSADVTAAYDPNYADVYELANAARLNWGVGIAKYTGSRGKSGSNDASAETLAYLRRLLDEAGVIWQLGELGKVDAGGGGTVAMFMANRNIETIDAGTPVLAMHAPLELTGKLDCYMTYQCMKAVYLG